MKKCKNTTSYYSTANASSMRKLSKIKTLNSSTINNLKNSSKTVPAIEKNIYHKPLNSHSDSILRALTSLPNEIHDNQLLKECKISSRLNKQINSGRSLSTNKNLINSSDNTESINEPAIYFDEEYYRKELGEDICKRIDLYCSKSIFCKI